MIIQDLTPSFHSDIKQHRVPAPGLSFEQPNLPTLMQEIMREVLPARGRGEEQHRQDAT